MVINNKEKRSQTSDKIFDLISPIQYRNRLPDIPFDAKFLPYPLDINTFVPYKPTSLENHYSYELHIEQDLGIDIDLIDFAKADPNAPMDPEDAALLYDDTSESEISTKTTRHGKRVSWLRKTSYISTNTTDREVPVGSQDRGLESNIKKADVASFFLGRDSQLNLIEKSFEDSKIPIHRHPTKPDLFPVETLPVFPDFKLCKQIFSHVVFDSDPILENCSTEEQKSLMSKAMIRGMIDSENKQFVGYFVPDAKTHYKLSRGSNSEMKGDLDDGESLKYDLVRDYDWNINSLAKTADSCFFTFHDDAVYYNKLQAHVKLTRRRRTNNTDNVNNFKLIVSHRDFNESELQSQSKRLAQLEMINPLEEVESEPDEPQLDRTALSSDDNLPSNIFDGDDDTGSSI